MLTLPLGGGYAVQVARSLEEVDSILGKIKRWLIALAARRHRARGTARAARRPGGASAGAAADSHGRGRVRDSRSLPADRRLGNDELSRLAATFNTMLAALEESARAQRQLVSDASHELRTPLTSLRTNIEVLARDEALPPHDREQLLRDVTEQLTEMTALIAELVELARGDQAPVEPEDVRLDLATADAIERTRRNRPGISFKPDLQESMVRGVPSTIERAISNLLDNAAKWSPPDGEIEVTRPGRRADGARPRPGDRPRRPALRLRPLLPRAVGTRHAGIGARARDRPAGCGGARRHRHRRGGRRWRYADAALAARAERPLNLLDTS